MGKSEQQRGMEKRIEELESRVRELERKLEGEAGGHPPAAHASPDRKGTSRNNPAGARTGRSERQSMADRMGEAASRFSGELWLNRIGLGLLLLGLAFLFKYSIDQGWLVPPVRSAIGTGAGILLLLTGLRMQDDSTLSQLLMGGGIAALYITGFATFQFYDFMPDAWLWLCMVGVTFLALVLSLQQDEVVLSLAGMVGGFGTPFMLYVPEGSLAGLVLYGMLLLAVSSAIYWRKQWKTMYWVPAAGFACMLFMGLASPGTFLPDMETGSRLWLQAGALAGLGSHWLLPLYGRVSGAVRHTVFEDSALVRFYTASYAVLAPLLVYFYSVILWEAGELSMGLAALAASAGIALLSYRLRVRSHTFVASFHSMTVLLLLAVAALALLDAPWSFLALAAEAVLLWHLGSRLGDRAMLVGGHFLFFITVFWTVIGLTSQVSGTVPFLGPDALVRAGVVLSAGLLAPPAMSRGSHRAFYRLAAHLLAMGWIYHECSALAEGQGWVSLAWGIYAAVLLVAGYAGGRNWLRLGGMSAVLLLVAKMMLLDLAQLPAVWRILLFMGVGSGLLFIGYLWQTRWRAEAE